MAPPLSYDYEMLIGQLRLSGALIGLTVEYRSLFWYDPWTRRHYGSLWLSGSNGVLRQCLHSLVHPRGEPAEIDDASDTPRAGRSGGTVQSAARLLTGARSSSAGIASYFVVSVALQYGQIVQFFYDCVKWELYSVYSWLPEQNCNKKTSRKLAASFVYPANNHNPKVICTCDCEADNSQQCTEHRLVKFRSGKYWTKRHRK